MHHGRIEVGQTARPNSGENHDHCDAGAASGVETICQVYRAACGEAESISDLIPFMFGVFLERSWVFEGTKGNNP
jgi:hypothetical protein